MSWSLAGMFAFAAKPKKRKKKARVMLPFLWECAINITELGQIIS